MEKLLLGILVTAFTAWVAVTTSSRSRIRAKTAGAPSEASLNLAATKETMRGTAGPAGAVESRPSPAIEQPVRSPGALRVRSFRWALLLGTFASGAGLRLWALNARGFNSDEAVYAGQAAALANEPIYRSLFPVFRAHPMIVQFLLALVFRGGVDDHRARLLGVAFGLATIAMVYLLGATLYSRRAGLWAAAFLAFMPYHVLVSRQILLDGPMAFFATATLYAVARFARDENPRWLYAAGGLMGLTILAKEPSIVLVGAIYAFLALAPSIRVRAREIVGSVVVMVSVMLAYPAAVILGGASNTARQYLVWQLFRRPNHSWSFYPTKVPLAIGPLLLLIAVLGLLYLRKKRSWREALLVLWVAVPFVFFQLWPVKGFQYLLPIAPPAAVLAGRAVAGIGRRRETEGAKSAWQIVVGVAVLLSLIVPSAWAIARPPSTTLLAGSGGLPGGREVGRWIDANVPQGAQFMTIGPSMANVVQFYGHRRARGLSVSLNPLDRNPSYEPIKNPDYEIRTGRIQYLVFDVFSAQRSEHFADALLTYKQRYNGIPIHTEYTGAGKTRTAIIYVYEVRP